MANIQLADNLRRLRKQYNYTQAQIGKKLHITHQAVFKPYFREE